jgi:G3E family GTPase
MTAPAHPRIPVALVTGFLGSGKTTLVNALLRRPAWADTAVVVNEFGEIGLDHLLIETASDNIVLLDSGCLCCAVQGGLKETLADLFVRRVNGKVPPFMRVVVETSGLADPAPLVNSLAADALVRAEYRLAAVVTTVDGIGGLRALDHEWEARRQVAVADIVVVTKTDLAESGALAGLESRIAQINPFAERAHSVRGDLAPELVFASSEARLTRRLGNSAAATGEPQREYRLASEDHAAAAPGHLRDVTSVSIELRRPLAWAGIAAWCEYAREHFGERLLRVKALLDMKGGAAVVLHGMGGYFHPFERLTAWPAVERHSRLVCIARGVDAAELRASMRLLEVREDTVSS